MKIAIICWGSLFWIPKNLEFLNNWYTDGPFLPIEFARKSRDGRLTLVIYPKIKEVQTLWAISSNNNLNRAIFNLKKREGTIKDNIGYVNLLTGRNRTKYLDLVPNIIEWAQIKKLDAVIWTDLSYNFKNLTLKSLEEYLLSVDDEKTKLRIKEYISNLPKQVQTYYRKKLEDLINKIY
ncbi:MAG: hypothetical protein HeimC3_10720 [Candidatus Heimdallarchaeota archaeon LC_3]|nr:MAG: hypothetical protein HeimC3_10720 [Candidatus Heimdallarchaeota archaeon LC_3]